jgi:hypothetical protein
MTEDDEYWQDIEGYTTNDDEVETPEGEFQE